MHILNNKNSLRTKAFGASLKMLKKKKKNYNTFLHLVAMSTICLLVCLTQILWTFSIYLESVAILPQLFMISKTGEAETITTHYLFFLGLYRALYLINWVWRFYFEGFFDMIAIVAGVVQTILYCDFFYLYITKGKSC